MNRMETAMFGAGCFWGVEHAFAQLEGVVDTAVGYMGGQVDNPTYDQVCFGNSGHAEVVQVEFDPERISYEKLLETFWNIHDPTQVNRQGPDVGQQYRSVIFVHSSQQRKIAVRSFKQAQDRLKNAMIATTIEVEGTFWRAEEYHQSYVEKTGQGACHISS